MIFKMLENVATKNRINKSLAYYFYKLSLSTFHSQMLQKAVESIHKVSSEKRYILGHTMCLNESNFEKARLILQNALLEITQLNQNSIQENDVYHFGFIGFPLTSKQEDL